MPADRQPFDLVGTIRGFVQEIGESVFRPEPTEPIDGDWSDPDFVLGAVSGADRRPRAHRAAQGVDRRPRGHQRRMSDHFMTDDELRRYALGSMKLHDPAQQEGNGYERCEHCHYTRHPCDVYELAQIVLALLDRGRTDDPMEAGGRLISPEVTTASDAPEPRPDWAVSPAPRAMRHADGVVDRGFVVLVAGVFLVGSLLAYLL